MDFQERVVMAFGGIAIRDIAERMGVKYSTLDHWLKLRNDIPTAQLIRISDETGCNLHWLLTGRGERFVSDSAGGSESASGEGAIAEDRIRRIVGQELLRLLHGVVRPETKISTVKANTFQINR
jgi:transcriptional regulator with XRE-family HTH domain